MKVNRISVQTNSFKQNANKTQPDIDKSNVNRKKVVTASLLGLAGLASVVIAGIAIANKVKHGKAAHVTQDIVETIQQKPFTQVAQNTASNIQQKPIQEVVSEAVDKINNGSNYRKVQREATRNQSHENKKFIQSQLREARNNLLEEAKAQEQARRATSESIQNITSQNTSLVQKANGLHTLEDAQQIQQRLANDEQQLRQLEQNLVNINNQPNNLTRRQRKQLRHDQNNIIEAQQQNRQAQKQVERKTQEIQQQTEQRLQNIADHQQRFNALPVERQEEIIEHDIRLAINAEKRDINKKLNQPKYKRIAMDYAKKSDDILLRIAQDTTGKYNRYEQTIAKNELGKRGLIL